MEGGIPSKGFTSGSILLTPIPTTTEGLSLGTIRYNPLRFAGRIWNEYGEERYANGKSHPRQSVRSGFDSRLPLPSPQPTSKAAGTPTLLAI